MQVAHSSHVINMTDARALRQLIHSIRPQIIVPEIELLLEVLLEIEEQHISRVVPTARAVNLTMNRGGIRHLVAEELQIAASAYRFANKSS